MQLASLLTLALMALALAAQPWSVLAGILLVTAQRGVVKETLFVAGWVTAISVVFVVSVALYPGTPGSSGSQTPLHIGEIVGGLALAGLLAVRWKRPPAADKTGEPAWLAKLDAMPVLVAFAVGAFLPNYIVVVSAAGQVLQLSFGTGVLVALGVAFVLLASAGVAAPLAVRVFRHQDSAAIYRRWREWLVTNSRAVTYATGAVVAVVLIGKGIVGLLTS